MLETVGERTPFATSRRHERRKSLVAAGSEDHPVAGGTHRHGRHRRARPGRPQRSVPATYPAPNERLIGRAMRLIRTPSRPRTCSPPGAGTDLIVPLANGEPVTLLDAHRGQAADGSTGVRVHQMHALHDRPYLHGAFGDRLRHVSYFLSHVTRPCFRAGTIDLVPNNFSEMRDDPRASARTDPLVLAAASPPDRHGYFSLGLNADYVAVVHRPGPLLPRGQPADAAHVRAQPGPHQPGRRLVGGGPPAGRGAPGRRSTTDDRDRRLRRRADPRRRHDPGRHRLDPQRHPVGARRTTATSASTPS